MSLAFDHVVVVVSDLARAVTTFEAAGFTVSLGGRHDALPTENALVAFADGAYLELLATQDPAQRASWQAQRREPTWAARLAAASAIARRFLPRLAGDDGVGDWVFARSDLARFAAESRRRGVAMTGPVAMERRRENGEALAWQLLLPSDDVLPLFIEDVTPRARRVPGDTAATHHANGAKGIAAVRVRAELVPKAALALADLLRAAPRIEPSGATVLEPAGLRVVLEPGSPGACGVMIRGVSQLPGELLGLGLAPG